MNRSMISLVAAAIVALGASGARAAPVTREDFRVETTGNLVALCNAGETDPFYTAARNFCHGFAVGTYRVIASEEAASRSKRKMFCMPANPPNRDQAIAAFVQWADARADVLADTPTDGLARYLVAEYPCK